MKYLVSLVCNILIVVISANATEARSILDELARLNGVFECKRILARYDGRQLAPPLAQSLELVLFEKSGSLKVDGKTLVGQITMGNWDSDPIVGAKGYFVLASESGLLLCEIVDFKDYVRVFKVEALVIGDGKWQNILGINDPGSQVLGRSQKLHELFEKSKLEKAK